MKPRIGLFRWIWRLFWGEPSPPKALPPPRCTAYGCGYFRRPGCISGACQYHHDSQCNCSGKALTDDEQAVLAEVRRFRG